MGTSKAAQDAAQLVLPQLKSEEDGALVAAVIDNRAGEVGLAVLEASGGTLLLVQHVETTRTFGQTLSLLARYAPQRLLVVAQAQDTGVCKATQQYTQVPLPRGAWDDSSGFVSLTKYATTEARTQLEAGMLQAMPSGYLAYAAAGALLRYLELGYSGLGLVLVSGSLVVRFLDSATHMAIDSATAAALELIHPIRVGTCSTRLSGMSLFRVLDRTKTKCGARLLRANLLQPLRDIATLNARYDCVEELQTDDEMAFSVAACLAQLPHDLDKMCGSLSLRPAKSESGTLRRIAAMIQSFILLHEALAVLPQLAQALAGAQCELLRAVGAAAGHEAFAELQRELGEVLEEDVTSAKNTFLNRTQQCFAVKKGVDGFLDVARQTFCRVTEQVHELASQLREQHPLPDMQVRYTTKRGFYFLLGAGGGGGRGGGGRGSGRGGRGGQKHPRELEEDPEESGWGLEEQGPRPAGSQQAGRHGAGTGAGDPGQQQRAQQGPAAVRLPSGFAVLQRAGRSVQATTNELNALNSRLRDASNDCMILTEQVLEGLSDRVVSTYLTLLHRLVDGVALLDMLAGFSLVASGCGGASKGRGPGGAAAAAAAAAAACRQYVRPVLTEGGPIALVEARHPVLECLDEGAYQPNDTFLALNSSFHIITGPNMSGKSTYLRQVALCIVAAQVGAFVPAAFASLPPCDRLLSRIGTGDSLETCSSSFMVECQEVAYILSAATPRSLVLIDELGRATSTADGVGIAWAVSEALIARGAPTLFATHFAQLTELAGLYPSAKAWHFDVGDVAGRRALDFSWRLQAGASEAGHYGLLLAAAVGFPQEVLEVAEEVVQALDANEGQRLQAYATPDAAELELVYDVVQKLACVAQSYGGGGDAEGSSGGGGSGSGSSEQDVRALQKQLRRLKAEAQEALAELQEPDLQRL